MVALSNILREADGGPVLGLAVVQGCAHKTQPYMPPSSPDALAAILR
jgi:hypothetical protein